MADLVRRNRGYRLANPEKFRIKARIGVLRAYNMTPDDYSTLLNQQGNRCKICSTDYSGGMNNRFHVDHDHTTGRVRGLLCHHCNKGLGQLKDSVQVLQKAINYLETSTTPFYKRKAA